MRRVSKSYPPRDVRPAGQESATLNEAEAAYLEELPEARNPVSFARSEFDGLEKRKLRAEMYRDQRSLCVYCERRIAEGYPAPRVDHWHPLSLKPGLALRWENLYLSCPSPETCDSAKGDRPLQLNDDDPHLPWPVDFQYEDAVGFTSLGEMYVRSDVALPSATLRVLELAMGAPADEMGDQPGIVNLNDRALIAARAAEIDHEYGRLKSDLTNADATEDQREGRAAQLLDRDPRPAFVSVRVALLRDALGLGR